MDLVDRITELESRGETAFTTHAGEDGSIGGDQA
jgi:hypothetical protein